MGSFFSQSSSSLLDNALVLDAKAEHKKTIIWLHGLGDSSEGFRTTFARLSHPNIRVVLPNAPERAITVNQGQYMRAWYDVRGLSKTAVEDDVGIRQSDTQIKALLQEECKRIGAQNVIIGGFSQGGAMAVYTGLQYEDKLAAIISCSGYVVLHQHYPTPNMHKDVPVFAYHGSNDMLVPSALAKQGYDLLAGHGVPLTWTQEPGLAHSVSPIELQALSKFWMQNFGL